MSFIDVIPSQPEAAKYVDNLVENTARFIRLDGHSKGGNPAIWASAHQRPEYKNRIIQICSNDGFGFIEYFLDNSIYQDIRETILSFAPESFITEGINGT